MKAVLYARFSTDKQSRNSIVDQFRVCERLAERHEFRVVNRFSDAAISGGTIHRPGYQAMLDAARRHEFDVIVAEDCSRLWRLLAEQAPRLAELQDLGIHVVTHDMDTRQESAGILGAVNGAMAEAYRREIGRRTRRGLEGRARQQKSTGGKTYGYAGGKIDPEQATIVREIFDRFARGDSQKAIAGDLNCRGVPSPGAAWKRRERASDGKWRVSCLHAMLKNEAYLGRVIWNRSRWVRSAVDSARRTRVENPRAEWIVTERPELALVDRPTWDKVRARCAANDGYWSRKARPRYLLSGLLECGVCGAKMTITGGRAHRYICSNRHTGIGCENDLGVSRQLAEMLILKPVTDKLLKPEAVKHAVRIMRGMSSPTSKRDHPRIAELRRLVNDGILSAKEAAPAIERLRIPENSHEPELFRAADTYREVVSTLRESLEQNDVTAARPLLREILGAITAVPTEAEGEWFLTAHFSGLSAKEESLLSLADGTMVAGVGFEPTTFGL